ncbi:DsbA family protein [Rhizobium mulingense]|uniref:DsbA family protein n=1 Tax=Rhizobium mulingense TaxID=3031128 RepID=UPI003A521723
MVSIGPLSTCWFLINQILDGLNKFTFQAREDFNVEGTPTFFVNGKKFTGAQSVEVMRATIEEASKAH